MSVVLRRFRSKSRDANLLLKCPYLKAKGRLAEMNQLRCTSEVQSLGNKETTEFDEVPSRHFICRTHHRQQNKQCH